MTCVNLNSCDKLFTSIEKGKPGCPGLNTIGYIPFVSTISATVRTLYAKAQIITGIVLSVVLLIQSLFTKDCKEADRIQADAVHAFKYCLHGITNLFRSVVEFLPIGGLVIGLPYDKCCHLRYDYPSFQKDPQTAY